MSGTQTAPTLPDAPQAWISDVPKHWELAPAKAIFAERKERSRPDDVHLTPSQAFGVIPQDEYMQRTGNRVVLNLTGNDHMRHVEPGDFISHLRSFQGGLENSQIRGKVSAAYTVLVPRREICSAYYKFLFKSVGYVQGLQTTTDQLRDGQSIRYSQFALLPIPVPPLSEQRAIADYLDRETREIDAFITDQEEVIGLLQERRAATIRHAVTSGLNYDVPLKDSGVSWLGKVPEQWSVTRVRYVCKIQTGSSDTVDAAEEGLYPLYVRSDTPLRSADYEFEGDAVLTAGDGAGVGKVFHLVTGRFAAHQRVYVMNRFSGIRPSYFYRYFSSMFGNVALEGTAKSTVDSVRRPMIADLPIAIPPLDEQAQIMRFLDRSTADIDAGILDGQEAIALLKERRAALISAAVIGTLNIAEQSRDA